MTEEEPDRRSAMLVLRSSAVVAAGLLLFWAAAASSGLRPGHAALSARAAIEPGLGIVLVIEAGLIGLGLPALVLALWPTGQRLRRAKEPQPAPVPVRPDRTALLLLVLGAALTAAVVVAVASGHHGRRVAPASRPALPERRLPTGSAHAKGSEGWAIATGAVFVVGAVAGIALLVAPTRRRGRPSQPARMTKQDEEQVAEVPLRVEWPREPRAVVLTAYAAMTHLSGSAGSERTPSEAPREFLRRRRSLFGSAAPAAEALTGLYEEARFSLHPTPPSAARSARAAYNELEAVLTRKVGV